VGCGVRRFRSPTPAHTACLVQVCLGAETVQHPAAMVDGRAPAEGKEQTTTSSPSSAKKQKNKKKTKKF
jgi:hypothetical protein